MITMKQFTQEELNLFTPEQQALLNKTVIAIEDIEYPYYLIKQGTTGTIIDFGKTSGDPLIEWSTGYKAFAILDKYISVLNATN